MRNLKFYIKKFSYCNECENTILKEVPMLMRRKLNTLGKMSVSNILNVYESDIENLVFSSRYGEYERLLKLIKQYTLENEVSPTQFSASVHNNIAGLFTLLKKINIPYYSVSSGENSLSQGLLTAVVSNKKTLFCYSDTYNSNECVACLITPYKTDKSLTVEFIKNPTLEINIEYVEFINFLEGNQSDFYTELGVFKRYD